MKAISLFIILLSVGIQGFSQVAQKINFSLTSISYTHNNACNSDVNGSQPDPRFIIEYRMNSTQNFAAHTINEGNEIPCGTRSYSNFTASMNGACSNRIELKITGWEENATLDPNFYNSPGDDNLGAIVSAPYYIDVTNFPNNSNITVNLTNGYSMTFNLTWNYSTLTPSTILSGASVCRNKDAQINLKANQSDITNYKWYTDSATVGTGLNQVYLGNPGVIPNAIFNTATNLTLYVAGTIGNNCETKLQKITIPVNDVPATLAVDANTPACYADKASIKLHNFLAGDLVSCFYDASMNLKAGIDQTIDTFVTDPQTSSRNLFLARKNTTTGCVSTPILTNLKVNQEINAPAAADVKVCEEGGNILSASQAITPSNFLWYDVDNSTILKNALNSTGTDTLMVNKYTAPGSYRMYAQNSVQNFTNSYKCFSAKTPVLLKIIALPTPPTGIYDSTCPGDVVDISATSATNGLYSWYSSATSTAVMSNGLNFKSAPLFVTRNYYVTNTIAGCESHKTTVLAKVIPLLPPVVIHDTICQYKNAKLRMPPVQDAIGYTWHSTATGNNPLASGTSYTTDTLSASKIYFAEYNIGSCYSPRTATSAIVNPLPIPLNVRTNTPICTHDTLILKVDDVVGCTYAWTGPNMYTSAIQNPIIPNVDEANHQGLYTLVAKKTLTGCTSKPITVLADINKKPDNIIATNTGAKCETESISLEATQMIQAKYAWSGPMGFTSTSRTPLLSNIHKSQEGMYKVLVTADGCTSDTVKTYVEIFKNPKPIILTDTTIIQAQSIQLDVQNGIVFIWDQSDYLDAFNTRTPTATPPIGDNPFVVTIYDDKGCTGKDTVIIKVLPKMIVEFTNFLSPNGDGANDTWEINYIENITDSYTLNVFSMSGDVVFKSTKYKNDFNGKVDDTDLPEGDYWYHLITSNKEYKGSLTLRR
jgi:gliding motility-associated-like protein